MNGAVSECQRRPKCLRHIGLSFLVAGFALYGAATPGAISGVVSSDDGATVAATILIHDLSTPRVGQATPFDHQFTSKSNGTFSLTGVPPGKYELCVENPKAAIVNPCEWSSGPPDSFTIADAQTISNIRLMVQRGYLFQVQVNDPAGLLPLRGNAAGAALTIVATTPDRKARNLRLLSVSGGVRVHFLVVPYQQAFTLTATSSQFALSDEGSAPFAGNTLNAPVSVIQGKNPGPVVINVGAK